MTEPIQPDNAAVTVVQSLPAKPSSFSRELARVGALLVVVGFFGLFFSMLFNLTFGLPLLTGAPGGGIVVLFGMAQFVDEDRVYGALGALLLFYGASLGLSSNPMLTGRWVAGAAIACFVFGVLACTMWVRAVRAKLRQPLTSAQSDSTYVS
jgi:hypothetical protein